MTKVLLLGIGNPGRRDDGLGPALAEQVEKLDIPGVTVDADYQLTIEDSAAAAEHDVLVIADAAAAGPEPYSFQPLEPTEHLEFSSHSVEPGGVLGLAQSVFGKKPEAWVLGIRGYEFGELAEGLSDQARANLQSALAFIEGWLRSRPSTLF
ncbi:MAG: hydrogenase maturation protease [Deltaproteobacteria bacterium]|nr:hydrogenase maturation protease [Deltaproteobacteria bacterium]